MDALMGYAHKSTCSMRDWQTDFIGPISVSEGYKYALFTCVGMDAGLLQAFSCK